MKWFVLVLAACGGSVDAPSVHVDREVETAAVLERLAGAREYSEAAPSPYVADLDRDFGSASTDPAVQIAKRLHVAGLAYERPMEVALGARAQPELTLAIVMFNAKLGGFLADHEAYIAKVEAVFRAGLASANPLPFFASLVGPNHTRFTLVPALLQGPQNYGVRRGDEAFQLLGLGEVDGEGLPKHVDPDLIVHEMLHAFVNPAVERHFSELAPSAQVLFDAVAPLLKAQAYGTPEIMVRESIVRAAVIRYIRVTRGDQAAALATRTEQRHGFLWIAELERVLATGGPRDFEARMPELVTFFAAQAKQGVAPQPFAGPIDSVFAHPFSIVASPATLSYARGVAAQIFHDRAVVLPVAADLPAGGLVAYGSPSTTPIVATTLKRLGIAISADRIAIGGRQIDGVHLVLIACARREDDATRGIVIYTAAADADIDGINEMRAGSTDWVVGQRVDAHWQILATGDFSW